MQDQMTKWAQTMTQLWVCLRVSKWWPGSVRRVHLKSHLCLDLARADEFGRTHKRWVLCCLPRQHPAMQCNIPPSLQRSRGSHNGNCETVCDFSFFFFFPWRKFMGRVMSEAQIDEVVTSLKCNIKFTHRSVFGFNICRNFRLEQKKSRINA